MLITNMAEKVITKPEEPYKQSEGKQEKQAIPDQIVEFIWLTMARGSAFGLTEPKCYMRAALEPVALPHDIKAMICDQFEDSSELMHLFVDRLSSEAAIIFENYFYKKTELSKNILRNHFWSTYPEYQISRLGYCGITKDIPLTTLVLQNRFPADFALFLAPHSGFLNCVAATKELNRASAFSTFNGLLKDIPSTQTSNPMINYKWDPLKKSLGISAYDPFIRNMIFIDYKDEGSKSVQSTGLLAIKEVRSIEDDYSEENRKLRLHIGTTQWFKLHTLRLKHNEAWHKESASLKNY